MKRKDFIRNISLAGVGISLAPTRLFASSKQSTFRLPKAAVHIPHGNFSQANIQRVLIPELNIEVSVQHFMRNGITAAQQDISVLTFHRKNEILNVCFDADGCHTSGEIEGFQSRFATQQFSLQNDRFQLALKAGSSYLSLRKV